MKIKSSLRGITELFRNNIRLTKIAWKSTKGLILTSLVASVFMAVLPFLRSGVFAVLINDLIKSLSATNTTVLTEHIVFLIGLAVTTSILPQFFFALKGLVDRRLWFVITEKFDLMFIKKQGEIDVATYEDPKFNDLLSKAKDRSIFPLSNLLQAQFDNIQNILAVILASIILISVNWQLFLILLVGSIPKFIVEIFYGRMVWGIFESKAEIRRRFYDSKGHFDKLPNLIELKLFQNVNYFYQIIEKLLTDFNLEQWGAERKKFLNLILALSISMITEGIALVVLILSVIHGQVSIGTMTFVIASIYELQNAFSGFFMNVASQYKDSLFVTDVLKIFDTKKAVTIRENSIVLNDSLAPEIEFRNVSFAYPGSSRLVLRNLSLKINAGEKLALVGVNGSGKTTIVKLLCRFYDPTEGQILVNGIDLKDLDLESWYHLMGVLFQDYATYHFSVKESIGMGRPNNVPNLEKVIDAAVTSESNTFIEEWPAKYDQMLGKEFTDGIDPSKVGSCSNFLS